MIHFFEVTWGKAGHRSLPTGPKVGTVLPPNTPGFQQRSQPVLDRSSTPSSLLHPAPIARPHEEHFSPLQVIPSHSAHAQGTTPSWTCYGEGRDVPSTSLETLEVTELKQETAVEKLCARSERCLVPLATKQVTSILRTIEISSPRPKVFLQGKLQNAKLTASTERLNVEKQSRACLGTNQRCTHQHSSRPEPHGDHCATQSPHVAVLHTCVMLAQPWELEAHAWEHASAARSVRAARTPAGPGFPSGHS